MKIFKLFIKHILNNPMFIIMNLVIFFGFLIPARSMVNDSLSAEYQPRSYKIGVVNYDANQTVTNHFIDYLNQHGDTVPLEKDDLENEIDLLYSREIDYALTIPEGFSNSLLSNNQEMIPLEKNYSQNFGSVYVIDQVINNYIMNFNVAKAGLASDYTDEELGSVLNQLSETFKNDVTIKSSPTPANIDSIFYEGIYLIFSIYILLVMLMRFYSLPMMEGRKKAIAMRETMSSITDRNKMWQYFLASAVIGFVLWLLMVIVGIILVGFDNIMTDSGRLMTLASLANIIGLQGIAFFIATIVPNKNMFSFFQVIISLLIAFGSGVFVPRMFISGIFQTVVSIASPIWLVKTSELFMDNSNIDASIMSQYWQYFSIMILIGLVFYSLSFFIMKYRTLQQNN